MKPAHALGLGLLLILAAVWLAAGTSTQDSAPEQARLFATALHTTPSPLPSATFTPTIPLPRQPSYTPVPTITPLPGWIKIKGLGFELAFPADVEPVQVLRGVYGEPDGPTLPIREEALILYSVDWNKIYNRTIRSVRVSQIEMRADTLDLPMTALEFSSDKVSLGRYRAVRATLTGAMVSGTALKQLAFRIDHGDVFWNIVFTAPAEEFDTRLPDFEDIIRTFTILS